MTGRGSIVPKARWGCWKTGGAILLAGFVLSALIQGVIEGSHSTSGTHPPDELSAQQRAENSLRIWADKNKLVARAAVLHILRDPDSAEFRDLIVVRPKLFSPDKFGVVCGAVNAHNAFGGYTGFSDFIVIMGIPAINDQSREFVHLWNRECANKPTV